MRERSLMKRLPHLSAGLACLFLWAVAGGVRAEAPPDPLRLVPDQADLFFQVDRPRRLIETVLRLDQVRQIQKLEAVREVYDSTNFRLFYQLIAYFEKQLGVP